MIQVSSPMTMAALEVARSHRPTHKFEDISGQVDLRSHLTHLRGVMSNPELTAWAKLGELRSWFAGGALLVLEPFLQQSNPGEETFEQALTCLEEHFAVPKETAESMLSNWLAGEKLAKKDGSTVITAVYTLCSVWRKAVQTNRQVDWDRDALYDRIIEDRLPFWIEPWSNYTAKRPNKVITFVEFEAFLLQCVRALRRSNSMRTNGNRRDANARVGATVTSSGPTPSNASPSSVSSGPKPTYASVAAQVMVPAEAQRPPAGPYRGPARERYNGGQRPDIKCYKCRGPHYLELCPDFQAMSGEEMREFLIAAGRCGICSRFHPNQECQRLNVRCWICQGNHVAGIHKAAVAGNVGDAARAAVHPEAPEEA